MTQDATSPPVASGKTVLCDNSESGPQLQSCRKTAEKCLGASAPHPMLKSETPGFFVHLHRQCELIQLNNLHALREHRCSAAPRVCPLLDSWIRMRWQGATGN